MNCGPPDQFSGFVDLNWGQSMDSAIPNSGEIFPQPHYTSTLLNSPPKLQLSMMGYPQQQLSGLGFGERASNFGASTGQLPSRVSSWQSLRVNGLQMGGAELGNAREDSSASDPISGGGDANARKRKVPPNGKGKDFVTSPPSKGSSKMVAEMEDPNSKRGRPSDNSNSHNDEIEPKIEQNGGVINNLDDGKEAGKESNVKPPEHPKQDFIHVRARRGQATDSHSLAERVRREKISERMKLLQDLVPGCNKVNGKALMLDEIINYVQSLQGQVEFLSMKLASVNPRSDFDVDSLIQKDIHRGSGPSLNSVHSLEDSAAAFSYSHQLQQTTPLQCVITNGLETQCSMNPLESSLHRTLSMQIHPGNGLGDPSSQLGTFWEDELHNVVQMGFAQNQEMPFSSQGFHGM